MKKLDWNRTFKTYYKGFEVMIDEDPTHGWVVQIREVFQREGGYGVDTSLVDCIVDLPSLTAAKKAARNWLSGI